MKWTLKAWAFTLKKIIAAEIIGGEKGTVRGQAEHLPGQVAVGGD